MDKLRKIRYSARLKPVRSMSMYVNKLRLRTKTGSWMSQAALKHLTFPCNQKMLRLRIAKAYFKQA